MKRIHFFFLAIAIVLLFVLSLATFSVIEYQMQQQALRDDAQMGALHDEGEANPSPTPTSAPTASPTPTPIPVYVPSPNEIEPLSDIDSIEFEDEGFDVSETEDDEGAPALLAQWAHVQEVDYYLIYIEDETSDEYHCFQILFASTQQWLFTEDLPYLIIVLGYADHAVEGIEDDTLEVAYIFERERPQLPTPTPGQQRPNATPTPSPTPAPVRTSSDGITTEYLIIVDKSSFAFAIFRMDDDDEHTIRIGTYPAALGGSKTQTGTFYLGARSQWYTWSSNLRTPFATSYRSGLYFHGPIYFSNNRDDLNERRYAEFGQNTTGGCVRTTIAGAIAVYNLPRGTTVRIVNSSDLVSFPGFPALDPNAPGWDPTDPLRPRVEPTPTPEVTPEVTPTPSTSPPPTTTATPETTTTPESGEVSENTPSESD